MPRERRFFVVDFEFGAGDGELPAPRCCVFREYPSGQTWRVWLDGQSFVRCPVDWMHSDVLVAYYASAEIGCLLQLGWPLPPSVLDLYVEFSRKRNGHVGSGGRALLDACLQHGVPAAESAHKESMRLLALRGGPYTSKEQKDLLAYCESDVVALFGLLDKMLPDLDLDRSLLRGRFKVSAARIEREGVPIDTGLLLRLREHSDGIRAGVASALSELGDIYVGTTFKTRNFHAWLEGRGILWPTDVIGRLKLDDRTFEDMSLIHSEIGDIRATRKVLSGTKTFDLTVGSDGRNRSLLGAYRSGTGRNQPSNTKFITGCSSWMRGLVRPEPGTALAYIDYSQQEFAIAAAMSGDVAMARAYTSGDPYLEFAKQSGLVPALATKASHPREREQAKACVLGVQYGMSANSLALRIGRSTAHAQELLDLHRRTYPTFWAWSEAGVDRAMLDGYVETVFGWRLAVTSATKSRTLANFPMQANGAEMLRIACILAHEAEVRICAPIHDALLIVAPLDDIEASIRRTQEAMREASVIVLDGFEVRTDVKTFRPGERFLEERGMRMWKRVLALLEEAEARHSDSRNSEDQ